MSSLSVVEIAIAIASIVSALGGCAAAYAAFLSARSAREAKQTAEATTKHAVLREASRTAMTIVLEGSVLKSLCGSTEGAIRTAMVFAGVRSSSGHEELIRNTQNIAPRVEPMIVDAELFTGGAKSLSEASTSEAERVANRLWESLEELRTLSRQTENIRDNIEMQNEQHRSRKND